MMENTWVIIVNPVAGQGRAERFAQRVLRSLEERGVTASLAVTQARGDAERIACEAIKGGTTRLVVCGGDGTVHEVVNGMMSVPDSLQSTGLGIVPLGRSNDLVRALGLPKDHDSVVETLVRGTQRAIDLGRIGDRYYATVATLGFDSKVSQYVDQGSPPFFLRGTAAYLYGVMAILIRYHSEWVRLRGDFGDFQGPIFLAATGNTPHYGGGMKITPTALVDDGWLDICLIQPISKLEVLRLLPKVYSG